MMKQLVLQKLGNIRFPNIPDLRKSKSQALGVFSLVVVFRKTSYHRNDLERVFD